MKPYFRFAIFLNFFAAALLLAACSDQSSTADQNKAAVSENAKIATDVIARVGDQVITFSEINTLLNSAAVVGLSIPALGTPERDTVRIALLDKFVDASLIYLIRDRGDTHPPC